MFAILCLLVLARTCPCLSLPPDDDAPDFQNNLPAHVVWAALGRDVELPCDVTPPTPRDTVAMVLWFKESPIPLYSLDSRGGSLEKATHSALGSDLGRRVYFVLRGSDGRGGARLQIKDVHEEDGGVFRCRVDFSDSPTRNFKVNLTLVVPPSEPQIFDSQGREVTGTTGPWREGFDLFLSCQVTGGLPRPTLTWWRDDKLLDDVQDSEAEAETVVNQLYVRALPRDMYGGSVECRAVGSSLLPPVVKAVQLHVYLKPVRVKIVTPNELVSSGVPHHLRCETWGSIPPAKITWLLDGEPIRNSAITVSPNEYIGTGSTNTTSSILTLIVTTQDGGKELTCRASNPWFAGAIIEDTRVINVAYPPVVSVVLTSSDNVADSEEVSDPFAPPPVLREGGTAVLECRAEGRPPVHTYVWFKDNGRLDPESAGMIVDKGSLRIPHVDRATAGLYVCGAANSEGETRSAPIRVKVNFAPRCRAGFEQRRVGALRHGTVAVRCDIDAEPLDDSLKFSWTYNNTKDVLPVPNSRVSSTGAMSQLHYTPVSGGDFGTLACWASNSAGRQEVPCLFHVVPAIIPQPPADCALSNRSGDLEVFCTPGFDGGLEQHFLLEVVGTVDQGSPRTHVSDADNEISTMNDQGLDSPLYSVTGTEPHFRLHSLQPGRRYQLLVWAVNAKGRSEPPVMIDRVRVAASQNGNGEDNTRQAMPAPRPALDSSEENSDTRAVPNQQSMALVLGALIGAAGLILSVIIFAAILVVCRRRTTRAARTKPAEEIQKQDSCPEGPSMYSSGTVAEEEELGGFGGSRSPPKITITPLRHSRSGRPPGLTDSIVRFSQPCMNEPDLVLARSVEPGFIRTNCEN